MSRALVNALVLSGKENYIFTKVKELKSSGKTIPFSEKRKKNDFFALLLLNLKSVNVTLLIKKESTRLLKKEKIIKNNQFLYITCVGKV